MSLLAALQALSASGSFASRAFLPLLIFGSIARWPQLVNWIPLVPDRPIVLSERLDWIASPWCLLVLAALAVLEALAERDGDARQVLQEIDAPLKAIVAFVTAFALVDSESASILRRIAELPVVGAGPNLGDPSTLLALGFALVVGGVTFVLAAWRSAVFREARDVADDFGMGKPVAWLEEAWSAGSVLLAVVAPVLAIIAAVLAIAALKLVQVAVERAAERGRRACPACGAATLPAASACPACGAAAIPMASAAGVAWPDRWLSRGDSELELFSRGRCPSCAERREPADLLAAVPHACGWPHRGEASRPWSRDLLVHVRSRVAPLALTAGLLGLLPVAGSVAALVLARARLGAPLRRFLPPGSRMRARWTVRLLAIPLLLGSGIPVLSAACAASLVVLSGLAWTAAFEKEIARTAARAPSPFAA
jgi:hypothetical protein